MTAIAVQQTAQQPAPGMRPAEKSGGDAEFTFDDLIDIINPLQHLPIVSTIYRAITGDEISPHARALGGGLYGGPIGILAAGATMAVEEAIGTDGETMLADMFGAEDEGVEVAAAPEAVSAQTAAAPATAALANAAAPVVRQSPDAAANAAAAQAERPSTRFFPLQRDTPRTIPLAAPATAAPPSTQQAATATAARAEAPALAETRAQSAGAPVRMRLSPEQNALLERFVSGAQSGEGGASGALLPPADGASPEWFAARMQANLQKYAAAQAAGGYAAQ